MHSLIFGANGQDGYYLNNLLTAKGIEATKISRSGDGVRCDVTDYEHVAQLIKQFRPTYVFHLAANSTTQHAALFENHDVIATGTLNILESVKIHSPATKVFITGSGVQFKNTGKPISEEDDFEANSAYSVARIQSVYAARYYRSLGIRTYVGYLFHHESSLRKPHHVSQRIAFAAKRIADGSEEMIELGDVSVQKEWTFAGDTVKGILQLIEQDAVFEAVIGSGVAHSIGDWVTECFRIIGKDWRQHVRTRESFIPEYQCLVSNPTRINSLGWRPSLQLSGLAELMLSSKL